MGPYAGSWGHMRPSEGRRRSTKELVSHEELVAEIRRELAQKGREPVCGRGKISLLSWTIAVCARRHAMRRAELLREVRDALEADTVGNLADRSRVLIEQPRGGVEADLPDELHWREAEELLDAAEEGAAALADVGGERVGAVVLGGDVIGDRRAHTIEEERTLRLELQR